MKYGVLVGKPLIHIIVEKKGRHYILWVNGQQVRQYSARGASRAWDDANLAASILEGVGCDTTFDKEKP